MKIVTQNSDVMANHLNNELFPENCYARKSSISILGLALGN